MNPLGALALVCLGQPAEAETTRVAIVPIIVGSTTGFTKADLRAPIEAEVRRRHGLSVLSKEELFALDLEAVEANILDCGADDECVLSQLYRQRARLGVIAVVNVLTRPPFVDVRLMDTEARRSVGGLQGLTEVGVTDELAKRSSQLLEKAGYPLAASLTVRTTPKSAAVTVMGLGKVPWSSRVRPGIYEITAELEGHRPARAVVELRPGDDRTISLELEPLPRFYESPLLWGAVGVAVIGTIAAVLVTQQKSCLCIGPDDFDCGC